jgi:putative Mn2+ efflux pump MntP
MSFLVVMGIAVGLAMDAFAVAIGTSVSLGRVSARQVFRFAFHFGLFQAAMPIVGWLAGRGLDVYIKAWDHWLAFALLAAIGAKAIVTAVRSDATAAGRADVGRPPLRPPQPRSGDTIPGGRRAQGRPPYIPDAERSADDDTAGRQRTYWPGPGEKPTPALRSNAMATSSRPARVSAPDPTRGWSLLGLSVATSIDALAVGLTFGVLGDTIWLAVLIIGLVTAALTTLGMHLGSHLGSLFGRRFSRVTEIIGGLVLIGIGVKILVEHVM